MSKPEFVELLKDTNLYKVGHHGSRNATPKTLWKHFSRKSDNQNDKDRLISINSTMHGKHGDSVETAVPRETLVKELETKSVYKSTETVKNIKDLYVEVKIDIENEIDD